MVETICMSLDWAFVLGLLVGVIVGSFVWGFIQAWLEDIRRDG